MATGLATAEVRWYWSSQMGIRTLVTLAALVVSGDASSTIAAKICVQVQHDLGRSGFERAVGGLVSCEQKARVSAAAASIEGAQR